MENIEQTTHLRRDNHQYESPLHNAEDHVFHQVQQNPERYFVNSGATQTFGYEQSPFPTNSNMTIEPKTKTKPVIFGVLTLLLIACCAVFTSIRVQMNNCSYWSLLNCNYAYQDLCCVSYVSSYSCPPDSIKWYTCKTLSELQSSKAALYTSMAIISGVLSLIGVLVFLKRRKENVALMTSYSRI